MKQEILLLVHSDICYDRCRKQQDFCPSFLRPLYSEENGQSGSSKGSAQQRVVGPGDGAGEGAMLGLSCA